jgi:hypothetical protein
MNPFGVVIGVVTLTIMVGGANAHSSPRFLDTGFGSVESGLQLSIKVDAGATRASFVVKNVGTKPVTFVEFYSCSGLSPWSLSTGGGVGALDHHFGFEPKVKGLTTKLETVCTVNTPTKRRTIAKGGIVEIEVPFAVAGELAKTTDKMFQANAALDIEGHDSLVVLHSAVQTR